MLFPVFNQRFCVMSNIRGLIPTVTHGASHLFSSKLSTLSTLCCSYQWSSCIVNYSIYHHLCSFALNHTFCGQSKTYTEWERVAGYVLAACFHVQFRFITQIWFFLVLLGCYFLKWWSISDSKANWSQAWTDPHAQKNNNKDVTHGIPSHRRKQGGHWSQH